MSIISRLRVSKGEVIVPVPKNVPGDFVIYLGIDGILDALDVGMAGLLLTWIEWVEVEVRGFWD